MVLAHFWTQTLLSLTHTYTHTHMYAPPTHPPTHTHTHTHRFSARFHIMFSVWCTPWHTALEVVEIPEAVSGHAQVMRVLGGEPSPLQCTEQPWLVLTPESRTGGNLPRAAHALERDPPSTSVVAERGFVRAGPARPAAVPARPKTGGRSAGPAGSSTPQRLMAGAGRV